MEGLRKGGLNLAECVYRVGEVPRVPGLGLGFRVKGLGLKVLGLGSGFRV